MVVANFCNNSKYISELAQVRVSKVSRNLERMRIESLLITFLSIVRALSLNFSPYWAIYLFYTHVNYLEDQLWMYFDDFWMEFLQLGFILVISW
jgi:hypothetical protein